MRRPLIFTLVGLTALGTAGLALGHGFDTGLKTAAVSAGFAAAPAAGNSSKTCTGGDGTYVISKGDWSGAATSSNARLSGTIRIRGELGVNQTTGLGWLTGRVRIDGGSNGSNDATGDLRGAIVNGKLTGFVSGTVHDEGAVFGSLVATVGTAGLTDGQLGGGSSTPAAILIDRGRCTVADAAKPVIAAKGTVSAVSASSLTLQKSDGAAQTCAVGSDLTATVAKLKAGDSASITCGLVDGSYRLLRIESQAQTPKPVLSGRGSVTAVSATSLTLKSDGGDTLTCVVGSDLTAAAAKLAVGDRVALTCAAVDGGYRIVRLQSLSAPVRPVLSIEGRVSAISATALTVDSGRSTQSCVVGSDLTASVATVSVGQKVKATCGFVDGSYRLLSLRLDR